MIWEGHFSLPGSPEANLERFADIERMCACIPGAALEGQNADGSYFGSITVAFGPKHIAFKGKATVAVDPATRSGLVIGQGASDMRAARFKVKLSYHLEDDRNTDASGAHTLVRLKSEADLQGVLAELAETGGPVVAKAMTEEFARRIIAAHADQPTAVAADLIAPAPPTSASNAPLSGVRLIALVMIATVQRWFGLAKPT